VDEGKIYIESIMYCGRHREAFDVSFSNVRF
jgi:hypothetical protein